MVIEDLLFVIGLVTLGFAAGWFFRGALASLRPKPVLSAETKQEPFSFAKWFKPEAEPEKNYPIRTMPRTSGPWRIQRRNLEAQHNTKQKERDALVAPMKKENANVR